MSERTCCYTENRVSSLVTTEKGGCVDWLPIVKILLREARPFLPAHVLAVIRYRTIVALFHSSSTKPCLLPEAKFFTALLTPSTFTVPFWVFSSRPPPRHPPPHTSFAIPPFVPGVIGCAFSKLPPPLCASCSAANFFKCSIVIPLLSAD